jgi:cytochrome c oxidase subunit III
MNDPTVLDVRELPAIGFGTRATLWWGIVLLLAIEGTGFLLLLLTYFYLRGNSAVWPPEGIRTPDIAPAALCAVLLLLSAVPNHFANRAAMDADPPGMRRWLIVATALAIAAAGLRFFEFGALPFTWYDHAYGSVFWTIVGMHTLHLVTGIVENAFILVVLFRGPVEEKHLVDVHSAGLYWYFMVLVWVPLFAVLYAERWW